VLDLEVMRTFPASGRFGAVHVFAESVCAWRGDRGGRVLTVRRSDLPMLALLAGQDQRDLVALLRGTGVLATGERLAELVGPAKAALL
jgi:hypothetical protein